MRIRSGDAPLHGPCCQPDLVECKWLYALCRNWIDHPGPAAWEGPDAGQLDQLMEAIALYGIYLQSYEAGTLEAGLEVDIPPF